MVNREKQRLTVLRSAGRDRHGNALAEVECSCQAKTKKIVREYYVHYGIIKSCGCLRREVCIEQRTTHGKYYTKKHRAWSGMITRCTNKNEPGYARYGGRGITFDPRWAKFENFDADMPDPPPGTSLDRKDNDGPYCKRNCRWATLPQQANNKSNNHKLTFGGRTQTIAEWARETGVTEHTIGKRLRRGWTIAKALTVA